MKTGKMQRLGLLFCLVMAVLIASGCATGSGGTFQAEGLVIELTHTPMVSFSKLAASQEGAQLVLTGNLRRRNQAFSGRGHVDVAVISPAGEVLAQKSVIYSPKILSKTPGARNHRPSRFEARLNYVPPQGSTIKVSYHASSVSDHQTDCDTNRSLL